MAPGKRHARIEAAHLTPAAEVTRRITSDELETPYRTLDASLETMATLDMIRHSIGIDFSAAGLLE